MAQVENVAITHPGAGARKRAWTFAPGYCDKKRAVAWARAVKGCRQGWTEDFGGEQFSLGLAFYTHLETHRSARYFQAVPKMDRLVGRILPGMQSWMDDAYGAFLSAKVVKRRYGFAGAGVHIFLPNSPVARRGGVVHVDTEGLAPLHFAQKSRAATLVVMLQAPEWGGGLRLWEVEGDRDAEIDSENARATTIRYQAGDALLINSRMLHQIRPFRGNRARISITLHGVEVSPGVWETWF